jgi:hypothetical protein
VTFVDFFGQSMKGKERILCRWLVNKGKVVQETPAAKEETPSA